MGEGKRKEALESELKHTVSWVSIDLKYFSRRFIHSISTIVLSFYPFFELIRQVFGYRFTGHS